jgi:hypothetical protein
LTVRASDRDGSVVTHDLRTDHGHGFTLSRVDLTRHNGGSRFVFGQGKFTKTTTRSGTKITDIVGNLHKRTSNGVESTMGFDNSIMGSKSFKLYMKHFDQYSLSLSLFDILH